jgi:hypothetical protein
MYYKLYDTCNQSSIILLYFFFYRGNAGLYSSLLIVYIKALLGLSIGAFNFVNAGPNPAPLK